MRESIACLAFLVAVAGDPLTPEPSAGGGPAGVRKVVKTDLEWARQLTQAQFLVCRRKATEPPFSGRYVHFKGKGIFSCVCCGGGIVQLADQVRVRDRLAELLAAVDARQR